MENLFIKTQHSRFGMLCPVIINKLHIVRVEPMDNNGAMTKVFLSTLLNEKPNYLAILMKYEDFIKELQ
ncbi:MAG: hypothetical protein K2M17_03710 [Bacilli bacterium]|nr:hypothetical protein [Bacilli bacterium]